MFGLPRVVAKEPKNAGVKLLWFAASLALPTAMRGALDPVLGDTLVYIAYFPAVLGITLMLGRYAGALHVLLSAILANFLFVPPKLSFSFAVQDRVGILVFVLTAGIVVITAAALRTAIRKLEAGHHREVVMNAELRHRVKNALAVVQALAFQTVKDEAHRQAHEHFLSRLQALSRAHDLLSLGDWEMCELPELARAALGPFSGPTLRMNGPPCRLPPETCVPLVLVLHELGTNAVRHGALSSPRGRVSLTWSNPQRDGAGSVTMHWQETGGPEVTPPSQRGLGSRLLRPQAGLKKVDLRFYRHGVSCHIEAPALPRSRERIVSAVRPEYPFGRLA